MLPVLPSSHIVQQNRLVDNKTNSQNSSRQTTHSPTQPSGLKRSSSMIFRIEHLLPPTTAAAPAPSSGTSSITPPLTTANQMSPKKSKFIRAGVHVTQLIPKDTNSVVIDTQALISAATTAEVTTTTEPLTRAYCSLTPQGDKLSMTASIMRKIKLSEDIHSYNALFELKGGQVTLRAVRDIERDEELVAWFGEELTLLMAIPFLTPMNIQGNNRYMCHWCHLTFETPNPLKIHLALGCGRHNIDVLWIRLHYALRAKHYTQQILPIPLGSDNTPSRTSPVLPTTSSTISTRTLSPSYSPPATAQHSQPAPRFSAFKPISLATPTNHQQQHATPTSLPVSLATALSVAPHHHTSTSHMSFLPSLSTAVFPHMSLLQPPSSNPLNAAAQIEAIVSNMGASKQGHLCIYCGKMYSRKYGLKIHIRTHTGFKPLKCKYCLRPFGDPSNLNKHIRLHLQSSTNTGQTSAETYQCSLCHKTFGRRRDLQKHMENRHGDSGMSTTDKTETSHSD
ncbi:PR/SET domain 13 [Haematobia irritans]|uniref:PR/SET domain 13 n=1 Tax=Haematobia irritans TaxID=7368 RepID=UPI003F4F9BC1